jgi:hypothetical protein
MICYRDKTFCPYHLICKNGHNCENALTEQVKKDAEAWMQNAPIAVYAEFPKCFVRFVE